MTTLLEGFYRVEFSAAQPGVGGIVCIENGQVRGGDGEYVYSGTVSNNGDALQSTLKVAPIKAGAVSVFGTSGPAFTLSLEGKFHGQSFTLSGAAPNPGGQPIHIKGDWVAAI